MCLKKMKNKLLQELDDLFLTGGKAEYILIAMTNKEYKELRKDTKKRGRIAEIDFVRKKFGLDRKDK